jgi:putative ABC transport system permease protein
VPPESVAQPAVNVIRGVDPQQPVEDVRTLQQVLEETMTSQRFSALVLGLFAAVALALASVGIYSVLSYIVRGRRQEIGIRAALGARTSDVVGLVVREGLAPTFVGIVAGSVGARLLQRLVFGVSPSDPLTLAAAAALLLLVATAASLVPAYRACRLDPVEVLRTP